MNTLVEPLRATNETIEAFASTFRRKLGIAPEDRIAASGRLLECVEKTGGTISIVDSPASYETEGGSLVIRGPHDYTIHLSPYTTPLRDNFTIGHELGHYVLHFMPKCDELAGELPLIFARYGTGLLEWQANRFAAALLLPQSAFVKAHRDLDGDIERLAGRFSVSIPAVEIRAKSLGLIKNDD